MRIKGGVLGLAILAAVLCLSGNVFAVLSGGGTEANPYLIQSRADFDEFANSANAALYWASGVYTKLMCNLDLSDTTYTQAVIAPDILVDQELEFQGTMFTGVLDGNGHTISDLTINQPTKDYIGLFGWVGSGGHVKNLGLKDVNIQGASYVGGVAGSSSGAISSCYSTGSVGGYSCVGGLAGRNDHGSISMCYSTSTVGGFENSGGLVGWLYYGSIDNCYSTGSSSGFNCVGGLVGQNEAGGIINCYSIGNVSDGYSVGGLVGFSGHYEEISEYWCDWVCDDDGNCWQECTEVPFLIFVDDTSSVHFSFWNVDTSSMISSSGGSCSGTSRMNDVNMFLSAGWDFVDEAINGTNDIWALLPGQYPHLAWQCPIRGDLTLPYGVEMSDLCKLAENWLQRDCSTECEGADLTGNGVVDWGDYAILAQHWLETTMPGTTISVPDVVAMHYIDASNLITAAGLKVGDRTSYSYHETIPENIVISQIPASGTLVYMNSPVRFDVSMGSNIVIVPNVVGSERTAAETAIFATSLYLGTITYSYSDTVAENYVISQNPAAGTKSCFDSSVDIEISLGIAAP